MSFLRHREIYQVAEDRVRQLWWARARPLGHARAPRLDESPVGYSLAGCSPAGPASASPTGGYSATMARRIATSNSLLSQNHLNSWSHFRGAPHLAQFTWLKPGVNETGLVRKNSTVF